MKTFNSTQLSQISELKNSFGFLYVITSPCDIAIDISNMNFISDYLLLALKGTGIKCSINSIDKIAVLYV